MLKFIFQCKICGEVYRKRQNTDIGEKISDFSFGAMYEIHDCGYPFSLDKTHGVSELIGIAEE